VIETGHIEAMIYPLLTIEQVATFEKEHELDFAFSPNVNTRFRVNLHRQRGYVEAVLRAIPAVSHTFEQLGLPPASLERICSEPAGLFLVAGPTGSGKTTTLSSMIEFINRTEERVIITIEDPIEYTFQSKKSVIKQRELGSDTRSYAEALKRSLRQDPDVICVGELVDAESVLAALRAAETGRLVLSTINAPDAISAVERVLRFFPSEQAGNIGQLFGAVFLGVIAQQLLPRKTGGRVLATEYLINTAAAVNIIREGKVALLANVLQTGRAHGMYPFQASIQHLHTHGLIDDVVRDTYLKKPLV
jgi:twitching motility protein PilT